MFALDKMLDKILIEKMPRTGGLGLFGRNLDKTLDKIASTQTGFGRAMFLSELGKVLDRTAGAANWRTAV